MVLSVLTDFASPHYDFANRHYVLPALSRFASPHSFCQSSLVWQSSLVLAVLTMIMTVLTSFAFSIHSTTDGLLYPLLRHGLSTTSASVSLM